MILSTIRRHGTRSPFLSLGTTGSLNNGASVGSVVIAQIVIEAGSAPDNPHDPKIARDFGLEHSGRLQAVARAGMASDQFGQLIELALEVIHERGQRAKLIGIQIKPHTAQARHAA